MFRRSNMTPRPDWAAKVEAQGLTYHENDDGTLYWDESVCYRVTKDEALAIKEASAELHRIMMMGVAAVASRPDIMVNRFAISPEYAAYIAKSWNRQDPHVIGRFDLAFDPATLAVKLIEYNADTPSLLLETAVVQRAWKDEVAPTFKQFNSLERKLEAAYQNLKIDGPLYFTSVGGQPYDAQDSRPWSMEEFQNCRYMQGLATANGHTTHWIDINDIGFNPIEGFTDLEDNTIRHLSKMYPWDWMAVEGFGPQMAEDRVRMLEPVWKMLASNKAMLAVLWELYPGHPNLLPTFFGDTSDLSLNESGNYFVKPITARFGENISYVRDHEVTEVTQGNYADLPVIYQAAGTMPRYDGQTVLVCSWMVGNDPAGMILRESESAIVNGNARIVPHYVVDY